MARWEADREELAVTFGRPLDASERLAQLELEQRAHLQRLQGAIDAGDGVRLQRGRVVLDPVTAEPADADAQRLAIALGARLPRLELTELLLEVDAWTQFSTHLTHAAGATPRMAHLSEHLHAALLAAATNLGPTRMAASSDLSYRQLAWATEWYIGDEQLQAANAVLVDYLHASNSPRTGATARSPQVTACAPRPAPGPPRPTRLPASSAGAAAD